MSDTTTAEGASYDPETGEVHEHAAPRRRRRRERTPEEQAVYEERKAQRCRMLAAVEALSPALAAPDDPPVRDLGGALRDVSYAREVAPLLRLPRASGQGGPGSALVVSGRDYDGASGGTPGSYVLACVEYHDGAGFKCRTRGIALRRGDLRPLARALDAYASELDAGDAKGT